jgi:hypothetical protein
MDKTGKNLMKKILLYMFVPFVFVFLCIKWVLELFNVRYRRNMKILGIFWSIQNGLENYFFYIKHGFPVSEIFDLSHTLSKWILPRLKAFKEDPESCPSDIYYDVEDEMKEKHPDMGHSEFLNLVSEEAFKRWNDIMDKMIDFFEEYIKDDIILTYAEGDRELTEEEKQKAAKYEGFNLFKKYFGSLWS